VHVPLFAGAAFKGKAAGGLYADVVRELDWSAGEILKALKANGVDDQTLFIFTSDNGPWLSYGDHAGSAGPLREGKGTSWEGGVRVPFLARWPGKIPAGRVSNVPAMTIDLLPTIAGLANAGAPARPVDGRDVWSIIRGDTNATSPHDAYYFYYNTNELQALRSGRWKLILPHSYRTLGDQPRATGGVPMKYRTARAGLELYDLETDVGEAHDVSARNPDVVSRLLMLVEKARADMGDALTKRVGVGTREPGRIRAPN
jgi:arylsulfatase A-like enzyme